MTDSANKLNCNLIPWCPAFDHFQYGRPGNEAHPYVQCLNLCVLLCRYNLLCEENPDEFVNVEIPSDVLITSNQSVVPPSKAKSHSRLVSRLRRSPTPQRTRDRMEPQQDISQVG